MEENRKVRLKTGRLWKTEWKWEVGMRKLENRGQSTEIRRQISEVGMGSAEVGKKRRSAECIERRVDDKGQKPDDGSQMRCR
jgi:hypothetical protein